MFKEAINYSINIPWHYTPVSTVHFPYLPPLGPGCMFHDLGQPIACNESLLTTDKETVF